MVILTKKIIKIAFAVLFSALFDVLFVNLPYNCVRG